MILPYVYRLTNPSTGEYYIGYRYKNVGLGVSPENDIGVRYFTSSTRIQQSFNNFTQIEIIAEFFKNSHAYEFEQALICECFLDDKCLNRHYQFDNGRGYFKNSGHSEETKQKLRGKIRSLEARAKMSAAKKGKPGHKHTDESKRKLSISRRLAGNAHQIGQKHSAERTEKVRAKLTGRTMTSEQKLKMSLAKKGKTWDEIFGKDEADRRRSIMSNRCGSSHSGARPVSTPVGIFNTVSEATKHIGISDTTLRVRCNSNDPKWSLWTYL